MAERAKRPCSAPRCPNLTDSRYCADHADRATEQTKQRNVWRGTSNSRGYDYAWTLVREQALKRDKYLCQRCLRLNRVTPATEVHHVEAIKVNPARRLDVENLESLCHPCHQITEAELRK